MSVIPELQCEDCPHLKPPFYTRSDCPACEMKGHAEISDTISIYRFKSRNDWDSFKSHYGLREFDGAVFHPGPDVSLHLQLSLFDDFSTLLISKLKEKRNE